MNALGAQELLLPALQPKENWDKTGRWDKVDVLFKVKSRADKEYALGPTHEEVITPLVKKFVSSYKELPLYLYQIQTKFRDELRAKAGVLRGREFGMKDLYSFHATQEDLDTFYEKAKQAYLKIFKRCGLDAVVTGAGGGIFTKKLTHEFQIKTPAGEDALVYCKKCNMHFNKVDAGENCLICKGRVEDAGKGIEAGNIFDLGTKFSESFDLEVQGADGKRIQVLMGCYGLGTTRLIGAIVEASHDESGIIWPKSVAPFAVHLISLKGGEEAAEKLYNDLVRAGVEVLFDDRASASAGEKFANADLIGCPVRLVTSAKTLAQESVEYKERAGGEAKFVAINSVVKEVEL